MSTHASQADASPGSGGIQLAGNERALVGWRGWLLFGFCVLYTGLHLYSLNVAPIETWTFRILHIAGGLMIGFCMTAAMRFDQEREFPAWTQSQLLFMVSALAGMAYAAWCIAYAWYLRETGAAGAPPDWVFEHMRWAAMGATLVALGASWFWRGPSRSVFWADLVLAVSAVVVAAYLIFVLPRWRMAAGTSFAGQTEMIMAMVGALLILELTRRVAGMALVVITAIFVAYAFAGPSLPGILEHRGYSMSRFFTYIYTDNGVLGPTTAVSSTYIILFITFAAFLQASRVGDYFVNFAFSLAGRRRGGPAKVAVFASGLMGMINGTSAGNVVSTGSLTIPLMKRVGYHPRSAGSIEAAASTGGQIVPPIMGAGAFIMAEITGLPYTEIAVAALIPGLLYFLSIYFMVDLEARREGMRGMSADELPDRREMLRRIFLFIPIIMLVATLFMGYSVIRAGTMAMISAAVVSWFTPHRMGIRALLEALALGARMAIPLVAVCACAGIIVGVISLTGVGARFASMLLGIAENSQLLALIFAMCISILLGMGMPTTAAYAVAASVVAPGLQQMGIPPLVAHFFVFYYAVVSAITPPVALAAYAAAAIAGSDPMRTSVTSFKFGLAAFIVPFMFFYSPALLMEGNWPQVLRVTVTASIGIYLLAAAIQGWFFGRLAMPFRALLLSAALLMIAGGLVTDTVGILLGAVMFAYQRWLVRPALDVDGVKGEAG
ncbi:MAG: TRAP transporter permease [Ectothiorhodospiraceae bacterium]|nr:TRAP transporter permease [Ectothiorhodospiraceae bacterium]